MAKEKNPKCQLQGKLSKEKGKRFEQRLDESFAYLREKGFAVIEKTPEPMRVTKNLGNGKFIAFYEKKAQPDYKGIKKGGRTLIYEAKYTSADRIEQSRVSAGQTDYMNQYEKLGARCFVVVGFDSGEVYCIPWAVWSDMKRFFGRKYAREDELGNFRVPLAWNGVLQLPLE